MANIKKSSYALLLLIFLSLAASCKKNNEKGHSTHILKKDTIAGKKSELPFYHPPKKVEEIKQFHDLWETKVEDGSFKKISFNYNCQNVKNGTLTYFFEEGNLRIIDHVFNEYDHFSATERYYITDGILFFVYSKETAWSFEAEGKTKDDITEYRGYIVNDQLVRCLEKKYTLRSNSNSNPNPDEIPNKISDCKNIQKFLKKYQKMATYKSTKDVDCI